MQIFEEFIEVWDWTNGLPTGTQVSRKEAHLKGIPHEGVHLWIIRVLKNSPVQILFQRRAITKEMYPGYLDITVGGHVPFGKKFGKIQKECEEEIGFSPMDSDLIDLGFYKYDEDIPEINLYHKEFQHIYLLIRNNDLSEYSFPDGEVSEIAAVNYNNFKGLFFGGNNSFIAEIFDGTVTKVKTVNKDDFHPLFFTEPMTNYLKNLFENIEKTVSSYSSQ